MRSKIIQTLTLILLDTAWVTLAFVLAYYIRLGTFFHGEFVFSEYFAKSVIMVPIWISLLAFLGRYSLKEKTLLQNSQISIFASLAATLLFPLLFYFTNDRFFSRGIVFLIFLLGALGLFFLSFAMYKWQQWKAIHNIGISKMLVIGSNRSAQNIITNLLSTNSIHKPVAILSPYGSKKKDIAGVPVVGKLDALERVFCEYNIQEIFLCEGIEHSENLASFCRNKGIILRTSLETIGVTHHSIDAQNIGGITFLTLQQSPLFGWGQFFKRLLDVVIASFGLLIFSPLFLYYRKNMKWVEFANGEESVFLGLVFMPHKKIVFSSISLLWNVLKKDISLVGPKALTKKEYEQIFEGKKEQSASRFVLRPGIFCGYSLYGNTPENIIREDIRYIRKWSFYKDILILLRR